MYTVRNGTYPKFFVSKSHTIVQCEGGKYVLKEKIKKICDGLDIMPGRFTAQPNPTRLNRNIIVLPCLLNGVVESF